MNKSMIVVNELANQAEVAIRLMKVELRVRQKLRTRHTSYNIILKVRALNSRTILILKRFPALGRYLRKDFFQTYRLLLML